MKRIIVLFAFVTISVLVFAQNEERYDRQNDGDIRTLVGQYQAIGGYGGLYMQYTRIDDRDAFVFGARGGILLGHMMSLGLGGSGFFNDLQYSSDLGTDISLAGGYGGFFFEPILMPKLPVHVSFPVLVGVGGVSVVTVNNDEFWEDTFSSEASDAYMVIEPGIEVEVNVTRFFRFCIGGYYRYTSEVTIEYPLGNPIPYDILRGFSGGVTFKFGKF
ncbi:MAG: hypothetical protein JXA61_05080 [Bacteroidales bacterium]|nr:hypothetical protein [Bacteroidales bacterium]